jgi:DNA-binding NtrC family response regulator
MGSRQQVLIIASDTQCRAMLNDILQAWNLEGTAVSSIQEAAAVMKKQTPLLVVCEEDPRDGKCCEFFSAMASSRAAPLWVALIHNDDSYYETLSRGAFDAIPIPCRRTDLQWIIIHALSAKDGSRRRTRS